jgi:hypothetical protein
VLNIAIALGYSDLTDEHFDLVTDGYTLNTIHSHLTSPCVYEGQGFCEFDLIEGDEHQVYHFSRSLINDSGENITVNIYTVNGSYSNNNSENKTIYKELQNTQTKIAKDFYGWALATSDMVFYEGHSRDGGGPDFAPPRQNRAGTVDYSWYHANKPGLKYLLSNLDTAQKKPMTVGLFSCASRTHFLKKLKQHSPNSKLILSTKVVEAGKTKLGLLKTLESVLNFECDGDLKARIRESSFVVN